jgi:Transcriptional regulator
MDKTCCSPRSSAKRVAVLNAAQECFLEHGYASTSMDMVAARAGVSKATIYAHFQNKDDLFGAIISRFCDTHAEGLGTVEVDVSLDGRSALTLLARHLLTMLIQPEVLGIYRMVVAESARDPALARTYYESGPLRGKARLTEALKSLDARGLLRVPDPRRAMDQFIGMLRAEFFNRRLLGLPDDPACTLDGTIDGAVETMLRAFGPR